jgi:hypothetical protein
MAALEDAVLKDLDSGAVAESYHSRECGGDPCESQAAAERGEQEGVEEKVCKAGITAEDAQCAKRFGRVCCLGGPEGERGDSCGGDSRCRDSTFQRCRHWLFSCAAARVYP